MIALLTGEEHTVFRRGTTRCCSNNSNNNNNGKSFTSLWCESLLLCGIEQCLTMNLQSKLESRASSRLDLDNISRIRRKDKRYIERKISPSRIGSKGCKISISRIKRSRIVSERKSAFNQQGFDANEGNTRFEAWQQRNHFGNERAHSTRALYNWNPELRQFYPSSRCICVYLLDAIMIACYRCRLRKFRLVSLA